MAVLELLAGRAKAAAPKTAKVRQNGNPDMLTIPEVAEAMGAHRRTVERQIREGQLTAINVAPDSAKRPAWRARRHQVLHHPPFLFLMEMLRTSASDGWTVEVVNLDGRRWYQIKLHGVLMGGGPGATLAYFETDFVSKASFMLAPSLRDIVRRVL